MQEKVTNYEISKGLKELGFDCRTHTGWWISDFHGNECTWLSDKDYKELDARDWSEIKYSFKAYDCWDLLMWLKERRQSNCEHADSFQLVVPFLGNFFVEANMARDFCGKMEPQNALGLAVIKILEEIKGENK